MSSQRSPPQPVGLGVDDEELGGRERVVQERGGGGDGGHEAGVGGTAAAGRLGRAVAAALVVPTVAAGTLPKDPCRNRRSP